MKTKKIIVLIMFVLIMSLVILGCSDNDEPGISIIVWENHEDRTEQVMTALINGDYSKVAEGFDTDMKQGFSIKTLKGNWEAMIRQAGAFVSIERTEIFPHEEYDIYEVITQHEKKGINTRIVFSEDDLIAGLFFTFVDNVTE